MMGMANPAQINAGIHTRLFARALAAHDPKTGKRFVFVSLDAGMGGIVLKNRVMKVRHARGRPPLVVHLLSPSFPSSRPLSARFNPFPLALIVHNTWPPHNGVP